MDNSVTVLADQNQHPRIAVIGDIMIDVDHHCRCERVSQEGPWPVFSVERTERRLGGAGNVARMVLALGADCLLCGIVGADAEDIQDLAGSVVRGWLSNDEPTTTKRRMWVDGKLTGPRIDQDMKGVLDPHDVEVFHKSLQRFKPDAIIVADHSKGVVTADLMRMLSGLEIPTFVDPVMSTPFPRVSGRWPDATVGGRHELSTRSAWAHCQVTKRGPGGVGWWLEPSQGIEWDGELPSACLSLVDPLGAGDQFIAALAYQRCLGLAWADAIEWANIAAGLQCERHGCHPVMVSEVESRSTCHMTPL